MAAPVLNVQPAALDLALYAGDGINIKFIVTQGDAETPIDITGSVRAQIRLTQLAEDPAIVDFSVIMTDAYIGIIYLVLTGTQTQDLIEHDTTVDGVFNGVWDVEWDPADGEPRTLCQGKVECISDVTR